MAFRHLLQAVLVLSAAIVALPAAAQSLPGSSMATGGTTTQPFGHYEFCEANWRECRRTGQAEPMVLTEAALAQLDAVNRQVNGAIVPATDSQTYGEPEVWAFPVVAGDCEDFVLLKRRLLAQAGWPLSDLLITMVFQSNGEGHAVLTVRTDRGDYILDNLSNAVRLWTDTPYLYVKRQSDRDAGTWVSIEGTTALAAAPMPYTPSIQSPAPSPAGGLGNIAG